MVDFELVKRRDSVVEEKYCPECGEYYVTNKRKCPACGALLKSEDDDNDCNQYNDADDVITIINAMMNM